MPEPLSLPELIERARDGSASARTDLYARFTPCLHRHIRFRLLYSSLRRHCDSTEIVDSVWRRFFLRLHSPNWKSEWDHDATALQRLLLRMADDNLAEKGRQRDNQQPLLDEGADQVDLRPSAEEVAEARDLVRKAKAHCSALEWALLERLAEGETFVAIARAHDATPDAIRMRLNRLVERLRVILGS